MTESLSGVKISGAALTAIDLIGEKWAMLIFRGCVIGLRHFEEFHSALGIARNILSDRLSKMVSGGLLERTPDSNDRRRIVYTLTEKGRDLLPTLVAFRQWAQKYGHGHSAVVLADKRTGRPIRRMIVLDQDGRELTLEDLTWITVEEKQAEKTAA